jgi:hypothetical protein
MGSSKQIVFEDMHNALTLRCLFVLQGDLRKEL